MDAPDSTNVTNEKLSLMMQHLMLLRMPAVA